MPTPEKTDSGSREDEDRPSKAEGSEETVEQALRNEEVKEHDSEKGSGRE